MSDLSDVKSVFLTCPGASAGANTRYQLGSADADYPGGLPEVYWLRALYVSYTAGTFLSTGRVNFVTEASGGSPSDSDSDWIMSGGYGHISAGESIIIPDDCYIRVERGNTSFPEGVTNYSPTGIWAVSDAANATTQITVTMVYT